MTAAPLVQAPLFVGGCMRSGTTMLGEWLGRMDGVVCVPEGHFIWECRPAPGTRLTPATADALMVRIAGHWSFAAWREQGAFETPHPAPGADDYAAFIGDLARQYARHVGHPAARRFVDHTPYNALRFAGLRSLFPDARCVHVVRDGRAVAASLLPLDFGPHDILTAAREWTRFIAAGLAAQVHLGPEHCLTVHYEDLLQRAPETLTHLAAHGAFDPERFQWALEASPAGFRIPSSDSALHPKVGQAPDPSRAQAWRDALTAREIRHFEHQAGAVLEALGYPLDNSPPFRGPGQLERLSIGLAGYWRRKRRSRAHALHHARFRRSLPRD